MAFGLCHVTPPVQLTAARVRAGVVRLRSMLLPAAGNAAYLSPSPYLGFSDSPFKGGAFRYFHLEDFEDGALNTRGVWAPVGFALRGGSPSPDGYALPTGWPILFNAPVRVA
jgi:hypothetical protein